MFEAGFTLIELLIVIVIIGILAGVVIGVLNPIQQQNRAKDGTVRGNLSKMALSTKSLQVSSIRSTQKSPTPSEFITGIGNVASSPAHTCSGTDPTASASCTFAVTGLSLPTNCTTAYNGTGGTTQCQFAYFRDVTNGFDEFRIGARGFANPIGTFIYNYQEAPTGTVTEGFWSCPPAFNVLNTRPDSGTCTLMQ